MVTPPSGSRRRSARAAENSFAWCAAGPSPPSSSERARPSAPSPANLRRYDRHHARAGGAVSALLPARFGTSMAEDELMYDLSSRRAALAGALAGVRGTRADDGASRQRPASASTAVARDRRRAPLQGCRRRPATTVATISTRELARRRPPRGAGLRASSRAVARWVRDERVEHRGAFRASTT